MAYTPTQLFAHRREIPNLEKFNVYAIYPYARTMTDLRIETVSINSLTLDPSNARKHDSKNLKAIASSLQKFGLRTPIVVTPDSIVVAGNGRLEAAKSLGWTEIAVARTPIGWTWDQIKAFAIADNRTSELAEWDDKILAEQLLELDAHGWELAEIGFENLEPTMNEDDDTSPLEFQTKYEIVVECIDEVQQRNLLDQFNDQGLKVRATVL